MTLPDADGMLRDAEADRITAAQIQALRIAGNEVPGSMPGRERVSTWLWERAASLLAESDPPVTDVQVDAAVQAINANGAVLYRETVRAALEAAWRV